MNKDIEQYHEELAEADRNICQKLYDVIHESLPQAENKVWHAHPVWFLDGNPIVGYHRLKDSVRMMFWSGQSFDEPHLIATGTFKAAEIRYENASQVDAEEIKRYIAKSIAIQWDYKNIRKNRELVRLK